MTDTTTANYGWIKPAVGASTSTWGGKLNSDIDGIDAQVFAANTTANSAQTNAANAASAASAAQTSANAAQNAANSAQGTANQALALAQQQTACLPLTGGTITGALTVSGAGGLTVTSGSLLAYIAMNKGYQNENAINGAASNGAARWVLFLGNNAAETGGNAGSNFLVQRSADSGAALDNPFQISRATGVITVTQAVVVGSDASLKKNVDTISDALAIVAGMRGVRFDPINGGEREVGLVAQEVQPVLPEVVRREEATQTLGIKYSALVAVLVEAVKELTARVKTLEAR